MGGAPYWYLVDYEEPIQSALDRLREREFEAGRYYPVVAEPMDEPDAHPGKQHRTIDAALKAARETGARSILDIKRVADAPTFCVAAPLDDTELDSVFGTTTPSVDALDRRAISEVLDRIDRGMSRFVVAYEFGRPSKILFAGYSFD